MKNSNHHQLNHVADGGVGGRRRLEIDSSGNAVEAGELDGEDGRQKAVDDSGTSLETEE